MQLIHLLMYNFCVLTLALGHSPTITTKPEPANGTSLNIWPPAPHTLTFDTTALTIFTYGQLIDPPLAWEVLEDLEILRRLMLSSSSPFTTSPVYLQSNAVVMIVTSLNIEGLKRKDLANAITGLLLGIRLYGVTEIRVAVVNSQFPRPGDFKEVAKLKLDVMDHVPVT